jgi:hypothetical protein
VAPAIHYLVLAAIGVSPAVKKRAARK